MTRAAIILSALWLACTPAPWGQRYGYYLDTYPSYPFQRTMVTPGGVEVDLSGQAVSIDAIDASVREVEECLGKSIDRRAFRVKVPADWRKNCDGTQEVLPFQTPDRFCKGEAATPDCPCRYRALLQEPNIVIATPNLLLFKDALVRLITGSTNPWSSPTLSVCATPHQAAQ